MTTRTKILLSIGIVVSITLTIVLIYAAKKLGLKNKNPKRILFVGDSQVAVQTEGGSPITYTYPNILRQLNPDKAIDVVAVGGKRTEWMVGALNEKLANNKYDRIYIHGGGNDTSSATPLSQTLVNIQSMVNAGNAIGADVFVVLGYKIEGESGKFGNPYIMPSTPYVTTPQQWIPLIEKRKELQRQIPSVIQNAQFVPIYDLQQQTTDGIHPNGAGHKIVADNIQKTLR
jgi:lysophospholipase L1-like esterase